MSGRGPKNSGRGAADPGARDPGDAVPPGVPGGPGSARDNDPCEDRWAHDPGDAVPPGVAPLEPAPLTEEDRRVLEKLRNLPQRG